MLITNLLFFVAVTTLALADVVSVLFLGPLIVTALSVPLLGESVGPRRWAAVLVGFLGAMLVVRPSGDFWTSVALLPVLAAFTNGFYTLTTRMLSAPGGRRENGGTTLLYTALVGAVVTSVALPFVWIPPAAFDWILLVAVGVFGAVGHLFFIRALTISPTVVIIPLSYLTLIWSTTLGFLVFGDVPDGYTLTGAAIIMGSGLYVFFRERTLAARAAAED